MLVGIFVSANRFIRAESLLFIMSAYAMDSYGIPWPSSKPRIITCACFKPENLQCIYSTFSMHHLALKPCIRSINKFDYQSQLPSSCMTKYYSIIPTMRGGPVRQIPPPHGHWRWPVLEPLVQLSRPVAPHSEWCSGWTLAGPSTQCRYCLQVDNRLTETACQGSSTICNGLVFQAMKIAFYQVDKSWENFPRAALYTHGHSHTYTTA